MKILGLSAGTKNGINDSMCKEALMGARESGADIEFIRLLDLNIKHCTGCVTCSKALISGRGNMCALKDDFDWLFNKMLNADGIVLVSPIFESGTSGIVHTITDRIGPRMDRGINETAKKIAEATGGKAPDERIFKDKVISFMGIGGSDWGSLIQMDHAMLAMSPMWKVIDNDWFKWAKSILTNDKDVIRAHEIGIHIAEAAKDIPNAKYQGKPGVCPHCHSNNFYIVPGTDKAICPVCGLEGKLTVENGSAKVTYPDSQLPLAHDTLSGKFKHADDIKNLETKYAKNRKDPAYIVKVNNYKSFISASKPEK